MKIQMTFKTEPIPKGRPRMTRSGRTYTPERTKVAEAEIATIASRHMKSIKSGPLDGALAVSIKMYFTKPKSNKKQHHTQRPDLDNCVKLVTDALNGIAYQDDSQIVSIEASKSWSQEGSIVVEIRKYEE